MRRLLLVLLASTAPGLSFAADAVDYDMVTRIRDEGFNRSRVMETAAYLTDVIGPRLTGSPGMRKANEWTRDRLTSFGLANARLESFGPFGRGWSFDEASVRLVTPSMASLVAIPKAWTPGTEGPVRGKVVRAKLESEADLEPFKGKLAGTVVLLSAPRDLAAPDKALFSRYTDDQLADLERFAIPRRSDDFERRDGQPFDREAERRRFFFQQKLRAFLRAEKVLAAIEVSERDGATVRVAGGGSRYPDEDPGPPTLVMAAEHYNRVCRLVDRKIEVELEVDVKARFHEDDPLAYNTLAEIPGTDKTPEVVMVGAHLDSWHGGTGATDNAAGSATVMEAVRILQALGVKPRRTIRVALWSGEEQGLLGSRGYVAQHFGARPEPADPQERRLPRALRSERGGALTLKPEHARLSAYFNIDNGTGKIRGIYTQQNAGAAPIFEAWLRPFADLGAKAVTQRNTGGTDHLAFDGVGLPGFQFIQDQADYQSRTHHTNLDLYDRLQRDDLMQASVVIASFVYHAAMREGPFPRKPLPKDPPATPATPEAAPEAPKVEPPSTR